MKYYWFNESAIVWITLVVKLVMSGISLFKAANRQKLVFKSGKVPWYKANKKDAEVLKEYGISTASHF